MPEKKRSVGSVKGELISKSREAALSAIKIFNDPLISIKSEAYIVLMVIAGRTFYMLTIDQKVSSTAITPSEQNVRYLIRPRMGHTNIGSLSGA